jgi:hypothetical protein
MRMDPRWFGTLDPNPHPHLGKISDLHGNQCRSTTLGSCLKMLILHQDLNLNSPSIKTTRNRCSFSFAILQHLLL